MTTTGALLLAAGMSRRFGGDKRAARLPSGSTVAAETLHHLSAKDLEPPAATGLLIANPPYGSRVRQTDAYAELGTLLATRFQAWRAAVLCPSHRELKALGRTPETSLKVTNGGIKLDFHILPPTQPV